MAGTSGTGQRTRSGGTTRRAASGAGGDETGAVRTFPDRTEAGDGLTQRQRRVLEVIRDSIERRGYPPSVREIGEAVGLSSASSVAHQLSVLQKKGWLRRDPNRPRALDVRLPGETPGETSAPTGATTVGAGAPALSPGRRTSSARGRFGSRRSQPFFCSTLSWWATEEADESPTASPISRTEGG